MSETERARGTESDRQELRRLLDRATAARVQPDAEPIVDAALARVATLRARLEPVLPLPRLDETEQLARLIQDKEWVAPPSVPPRVLLALSRFLAGTAQANGSLGNNAAGMTQLLAEDLGEELAGYRSFCSARERLGRRRFGDLRQREQRLLEWRRQIRARIQARRWRRSSNG